MLFPFISFLSKISTDEVKKVLMIILKGKFQLISYIENKHFNLEGIAKELYGKITKKMKILILQKFLLN